MSKPKSLPRQPLTGVEARHALLDGMVILQRELDERLRFDLARDVLTVPDLLELADYISRVERACETLQRATGRFVRS